jgi:hypothetical protein
VPTPVSESFFAFRSSVSAAWGFHTEFSPFSSPLFSVGASCADNSGPCSNNNCNNHY